MEAKLVYNEIHKGALMGIESIDTVKKIIERQSLKNLLNRQRAEYKMLLDEAEQEAQRNGVKLSGIPAKDRIMLKFGIYSNTLFNQSAEKVSEMLIQGTNLGIISLTRALNRTDTENPIAIKMMNAYNRNLEDLKTYL